MYSSRIEEGKQNFNSFSSYSTQYSSMCIRVFYIYLPLSNFLHLFIYEHWYPYLCSGYLKIQKKWNYYICSLQISYHVFCLDTSITLLIH